METSNFATWLSRQLVRRGWRQADLARRSGLNATSISEWVRGIKTPDPKSIDLLADALGLDADTVLAVAGHRPPSEEIDPDSAAGRVIALAKRVRWNDEREDAILSILNNYLKFDRKRTEGE